MLRFVSRVLRSLCNAPHFRRARRLRPLLACSALSSLTFHPMTQHTLCSPAPEAASCSCSSTIQQRTPLEDITNTVAMSSPPARSHAPLPQSPSSPPTSSLPELQTPRRSTRIARASASASSVRVHNATPGSSHPVTPVRMGGDLGRRVKETAGPISGGTDGKRSVKRLRLGSAFVPESARAREKMRMRDEEEEEDLPHHSYWDSDEDSDSYDPSPPRTYHSSLGLHDRPQRPREFRRPVSKRFGGLTAGRTMGALDFLDGRSMGGRRGLSGPGGPKSASTCSRNQPLPRDIHATPSDDTTSLVVGSSDTRPLPLDTRLLEDPGPLPIHLNLHPPRLQPSLLGRLLPRSQAGRQAAFGDLE